MRKKDVLSHLNAVGVLVASGPGSRGWWIRRELEAAWNGGEGCDPEDVGPLEELGLVTPRGPSIYVDRDGTVYVGGGDWVWEVM